MKNAAIATLLLTAAMRVDAGGPLPQAAASPEQNTLADLLQRKVDHLIENGRREKPDSRPTVLTDREVDAYMNSGRLQVPDGVSDIHLVTTPGEAVATATVDFDKLTAGVRKTNPLWSLFTGLHEVKVRCGVWGKDGMGNVHVQNVWLDGHEIPRMALEFFVDHYLKPRVPQASLDSRFRMPVRIWTALVGNGKTTLLQR